MTPSHGALLSIAGTDPCGAAGIQVDLQVFRDFGFHGLSAITAVVSQNTGGVRALWPVPGECLQSQLEALAQDVPIRGIKIGLLPDAQSVDVVERFLGHWPRTERPPVVLDPVLQSGDGQRALATPGAVQAIAQKLLAQVDLVTPNIPEAERLLGRPIGDVAAMALAAQELAGRGPAVLLKAGHLGSGTDLSDVLAWENGCRVLAPLPRVPFDARGTGCQLSSALLACAVGAPGGPQGWHPAAERARRYLNELLQHHALAIGQGRPVVVRSPCRDELP